MSKGETVHRELFKITALPLWVHDPATGRFLAVNDATTTTYQWSRDELLGTTIETLVPSAADRDTLDRITPSTFVDGGTHRRKDGSVLRVEVSIQETDYDGRRARLVVAVDVTERKRAENLLMKSERQLADAQEIAHVGSFEWETETDVVRWSDELYRIYGLKPREFEATYAAFLERIHPDDRSTVDAAVRRSVEQGQPFQMEERIVRPDGTIRMLETRGHFIPAQRRLVGVCRDVTELLEARRIAEAARAEVHDKEDELRELSERLARTEQFSLVMVTLVTMDGYFSRVPQSLCKLLGYTEQELLSMDVEEVIHPDDLEDDRVHRQRIVRREVKSLDIELRLVPKGGGVVWVYLNCSAVYDSSGQQTHFIVYLRDITERHRAEERIRYQALHDDLTDLPNRVLFNDRLDQAIAHAQRLDTRLAVIAIDLDDFKFVNDNFGHSFGDIVIREAAARLKMTLRTNDTIARIGGDEFVIIVQDLKNEQQAYTIARKVREIFRDRFDAGTSSVHVTSCVGISIFPRDGHDGDTLLRSSETALNRAKEIGHDNIQLFDESMSGRFRDRLMREQELHQAIEASQLLSWYQPILRSSDLKIVAVEALCRWNHPQRGMVGPDEFIPLAEETRLIVPIGEFVLRTACLDVQRWTDHKRDLRLSVNLSVRQFQEMTLLHTIDSILTETSFDPSRLEFEVTESVAMQNADFTMGLLRDLRQRNIAIAIDDFGVGQSSLIYLRQFPINTIKIDKVFINDILTDATDAAIVRAIIGLAHTLGLCATAEGVESEEQVHMLQDFGCDLLQGYYFSRPLPAAEMERLL